MSERGPLTRGEQFSQEVNERIRLEDWANEKQHHEQVYRAMLESGDIEGLRREKEVSESARKLFDKGGVKYDEAIWHIGIIDKMLAEYEAQEDAKKQQLIQKKNAEEFVKRRSHELAEEQALIRDVSKKFKIRLPQTAEESMVSNEPNVAEPVEGRLSNVSDSTEDGGDKEFTVNSVADDTPESYILPAYGAFEQGGGAFSLEQDTVEHLEDVALRAESARGVDSESVDEVDGIEDGVEYDMSGFSVELDSEAHDSEEFEDSHELPRLKITTTDVVGSLRGEGGEELVGVKKDRLNQLKNTYNKGALWVRQLGTKEYWKDEEHGKRRALAAGVLAVTLATPLGIAAYSYDNDERLEISDPDRVEGEPWITADNYERAGVSARLSEAGFYLGIERPDGDHYLFPSPPDAEERHDPTPYVDMSGVDIYMDAYETGAAFTIDTDYEPEGSEGSDATEAETSGEVDGTEDGEQVALTLDRSNLQPQVYIDTESVIDEITLTPTLLNDIDSEISGTEEKISDEETRNNIIAALEHIQSIVEADGAIEAAVNNGAIEFFEDISSDEERLNALHSALDNYWTEVLKEEAREHFDGQVHINAIGEYPEFEIVNEPIDVEGLTYISPEDAVTLESEEESASEE